MDVKQLEKLKKLKDKGLITEKEFNEQRAAILSEFSDKPKNGRWLKNVLWAIVIFVCVLLVVGMLDEGPNFACDETTMKAAQDLANKNYPNWNNALKLSEPTVVKQEENYLKCKVKTNFRELPVMHYELTKDKDGDMLIGVNPMADAFRNLF